MKTVDATNINQAVAYANLTANKSAKRYLAYRICLPVCSALFFLLSVILAYGAVEFFVLRPLAREGISADIYRIPILSELWEGGVLYKIALLLGTVTVWYRFAALCAAVLFVVPMITALIIFSIVWLFYHPETAQSDIHTYEENIARKLYQKAEASAEYRWCDAKLILLFSLLFVVYVLGLAIHIELVALSPQERGEIIEIISSIGINLFAGIICSGLILALYACLMHISLRLWERLVEPRKNAAFIDACRDYWHRNAPDLIKQQKEAEHRRREEKEREEREKLLKWEKEREEKEMIKKMAAIWTATNFELPNAKSSSPTREEMDDEMDFILKNMPDDLSKDM